jgi:hypothetical protein
MAKNDTKNSSDPVNSDGANVAQAATEAQAAADVQVVDEAPEAAAVEQPGMSQDELLTAATDMHSCMAEFIASAERHSLDAARAMDMAMHTKFHNISLAFAEFRQRLSVALSQ